jgi:hypothetical protein
MRFLTTIVLDGNNTGIEVPGAVVAQLGPGKRYPVVVTVGEHSYRSSVSVYKGRFMISLSAENRKRAGVSGGDEVEVDIVLDEAPREVELPVELSSALADDPKAKAAFDALSFSNRNRIALSVETAKSAETRARRVAKAIDELRA